MKQWAEEKKNAYYKRSCSRENRDQKGEERISRKGLGREEKNLVGALCTVNRCPRGLVAASVAAAPQAACPLGQPQLGSGGVCGGRRGMKRYKAF